MPPAPSWESAPGRRTDGAPKRIARPLPRPPPGPPALPGRPPTAAPHPRGPHPPPKTPPASGHPARPPRCPPGPPARRRPPPPTPSRRPASARPPGGWAPPPPARPPPPRSARGNPGCGDLRCGRAPAPGPPCPPAPGAAAARPRARRPPARSHRPRPDGAGSGRAGPAGPGEPGERARRQRAPAPSAPATPGLPAPHKAAPPAAGIVRPPPRPGARTPRRRQAAPAARREAFPVAAPPPPQGARPNGSWQTLAGFPCLCRRHAPQKLLEPRGSTRQIQKPHQRLQGRAGPVFLRGDPCGPPANAGVSRPADHLPLLFVQLRPKLRQDAGLTARTGSFPSQPVQGPRPNRRRIGCGCPACPLKAHGRLQCRQPGIQLEDGVPDIGEHPWGKAPGIPCARRRRRQRCEAAGARVCPTCGHGPHRFQRKRSVPKPQRAASPAGSTSLHRGPEGVSSTTTPSRAKDARRLSAC